MTDDNKKTWGTRAKALYAKTLGRIAAPDDTTPNAEDSARVEQFYQGMRALMEERVREDAEHQEAASRPQAQQAWITRARSSTSSEQGQQQQ